MADGEKSKLKHKYGRIDFDYAMHLATRPPEEDGPIYMVNLMKYHEVAQYSDDASPSSKPVSYTHLTLPTIYSV